VKVVWHEAVRVDSKVASCGGFAEDFKREVAEVRICEIRAAIVATESDEDGNWANVILEVEADILSRVH